MGGVKALWCALPVLAVVACSEGVNGEGTGASDEAAGAEASDQAAGAAATGSSESGDEVPSGPPQATEIDISGECAGHPFVVRGTDESLLAVRRGDGFAALDLATFVRYTDDAGSVNIEILVDAEAVIGTYEVPTEDYMTAGLGTRVFVSCRFAADDDAFVAMEVPYAPRVSQYTPGVGTLTIETADATFHSGTLDAEAETELGTIRAQGSWSVAPPM